MRPAIKGCLSAVVAMLVAGGNISADATEVLAANEAPEQASPSMPTVQQTDRAVQNALRWLAEQQLLEGEHAGSWPCAKYRSAVAALAGLAFLAQGHLPGEGPYGEAIDRAMAFVQKGMRNDGYLGGAEDSMYVHAICSLFGLSYLGMAKDSAKNRELAEWCRKSINLIVQAQKIDKYKGDEGGWRYTPEEKSSDVSVTAWQLFTLHAARQCGYEIEDEVFDNALKFIEARYVDEDEHRGGYLYRLRKSGSGADQKPHASITGVVVLLQCLLRDRLDVRTEKALAYLKGFEPSWGGAGFERYYFFETFYFSQGMFQLGGETWRRLGPRLQKVLLDHQQGDGSWAFPPGTLPEPLEAGTSYATSMAVLMLSLEKQYLPMFQRQRKLF